jgi:hypothetical protein
VVRLTLELTCEGTGRSQQVSFLMASYRSLRSSGRTHITNRDAISEEEEEAVT